MGTKTILIALIFLTIHVNAQILQLQKCLGGSSDEYLGEMVQTTDSGFVVAGYSCSYNGDVSGGHGFYDFWVVKLNDSLNIEWQKCYGGTDEDRARSIVQTMDSGYIVAGSTKSNNGDVTGNHGDRDYWVIKLDETGNIQWQRCLGGTGDDRAHSILQSSDSCYVVAGFSKSSDGDVTGNNGRFDFWIVKLDNLGNIQWENNFGGIVEDYAFSLIQTIDQGYVIAGEVDSYDSGDVLGNHGSSDFWIIKLDSTGNLLWQKCLGGTESDYANSIIQTTDTGFIVTGSTFSNNWDVSGNHGPKDMWVTKLDISGNIQWQKCFGGSQWDGGSSIIQTSDGGYVSIGESYSDDGDHQSSNYGSNDIWIVKTDSMGNLEWEKSFGGTSWDWGKSIVQVNHNEYLIGATTNSSDGDIIGSHGGVEYWISKISIPIEVDFLASNSLINLGDTTIFTDLSLGNSISYYWDFGDNTIDTLKNPVHVYQAPGNYTVSLKVFDSIDGYTKTKANYITVLPYSEQDIEVAGGWNIVSFNVMPENIDLLNIFQPLINNSNLVKVIDESGKFIQYIPGIGWMNTIGDMAYTEGYYLKVLINDTLIIEGNNVPVPTSIPLQSGWNLIGYPLQDTNNAISILQPLIDSSFLIKAIDEGGGFIQNIPGFGWMNTIDVFNSGNGYYLKVNSNCSLTIDTNWQCGEILIDERDGKTYSTKLIGNQCWMTENLNVGMRIDGINDQLDNGVIEKYCNNNNETNCDLYGGLYQWDEMKQYTPEPFTQGICPEGWHIPSDQEWKELEGNVDSQYHVGDPEWDNENVRGHDAGQRLKSTTGWSYGGDGTDDFNFTAYPGGFRYDDGTFMVNGQNTWIWTSSSVGSGAWYRHLDYNYNGIIRRPSFKSSGLSVRCVKD